MCSDYSITPYVAVSDGCWAVIAIGSKYNILCVSNMLYDVMNSGSFTVVVLLCVGPQLSVYMWLGSSGPDLGPVGHTGSMGLVVSPRACIGS